MSGTNLSLAPWLMLACLGLWAIGALGDGAGYCLADASPPGRYALLIHHNTGAPGSARLLYTEADALRVGAVLRDMGGVPEENITRLNRPGPGEVLRALKALGERAEAEGAKEGGRLFVYYSGHAEPGALWLGEDTLDIPALERAIAQTAIGTRVVIVDACHSGALTREKGGRRSPPFLVHMGDGGLRGQVILTSSSLGESSQESDRLGGGIFTHHLVTGLRGAADVSGDGLVTLEEIYSYAYHETLMDTASSASGVQHPTFSWGLKGQGAMVLTRTAGEGTSLYFPPGSEGTYLVFDRTHRSLVGEVRLRGEGRRLGLPPGSYLVQKRGGDHLLAAEMTLSQGASAMLEEGSMERRALEEDFTKGVVTANRLRAQGPRHILGLSLGGQAFFDTPVRETLVPSTPLIGLQFESLGIFAPTLSLRIDGDLGQIDALQLIEGSEIPITLTTLKLGVGLLRHWPLGPVDFYAGPHLSGVYLRRSFRPPLTQAPQTLTSLTPGVLGGVRLGLGPKVGISVEVRGHYLFYRLDEDLSLGFSEISGGTYVRF